MLFTLDVVYWWSNGLYSFKRRCFCAFLVMTGNMVILECEQRKLFHFYWKLGRGPLEVSKFLKYGCTSGSIMAIFWYFTDKVCFFQGRLRSRNHFLYSFSFSAIYRRICPVICCEIIQSRVECRRRLVLLQTKSKIALVQRSKHVIFH